MKRRWNLFVWTGFALTLVAFLSYYFYFLRFPSTRDFPWFNLLLFVAAGVLLGIGLKRAYGDPARYRGKISGAILGVLSLAVFALFCVFNFVLAKNLPTSNTAPRAGQQAPAFSLADANGKPVSLSGMLAGNRAVVLVFYRGYW
jgi:peptidoglycan/LPS O-acetylase OafA/YrhL